MRVFIFGDANVDVTAKWSDVEEALERMSPANRRLVSRYIAESRKTGTDIEAYLPARSKELSDFFASLEPRVEFGGCGAIKARMMGLLGHDVSFFSWVGDDKRGRAILDELSKAGVDTSGVIMEGETCETFNLFDPEEARLAFSFWESKLDFSEFVKAVKRERPDKVFLTGAHRIKAALGYSRLPGAYVFTGSFAPYSEKELAAKYKADLSKGILVGNETEMMRLAGAPDPMKAIIGLKNRIAVMHTPTLTAVKRGGTVISARVPQAKGRVVELTGIGDVWESFFLGSVGDLETASEKDIKASMRLADKASIHRMTTGEFPVLGP